MRHSRRNLLAGLAFALASLMGFVLLPSPVTAQTFYGTMTGTVTDPTGGVLPGASVTVTNTGTNSKAHAVTDAAGNFRFVNLVPASYQVDVEMAGFKHSTRGTDSRAGASHGPRGYRSWKSGRSPRPSKSPPKRSCCKPSRESSAPWSPGSRCRRCRSTAATS